MTMDSGRDDKQPAKKKAVDDVMVAVGRALADKFGRWRMSNDCNTSVLLLSSAATTMPPCSPLHCAAATAAATASEEAPAAAGLMHKIVFVCCTRLLNILLEKQVFSQT